MLLDPSLDGIGFGEVFPAHRSSWNALNALDRPRTRGPRRSSIRAARAGDADRLSASATPRRSRLRALAERLAAPSRHPEHAPQPGARCRPRSTSRCRRRRATRRRAAYRHHRPADATHSRLRTTPRQPLRAELREVAPARHGAGPREVDLPAPHVVELVDTRGADLDGDHQAHRLRLHGVSECPLDSRSRRQAPHGVADSSFRPRRRVATTRPACVDARASTSTLNQIAARPV